MIKRVENQQKALYVRIFVVSRGSPLTIRNVSILVSEGLCLHIYFLIFQKNRQNCISKVVKNIPE